MKSSIFTLLFIVSLFSISAQSDTTAVKKKFNFGVRHGYTNWDVKSENAAYNKTYLIVGLFAERRISDKLSIRLEVNYSHREVFEIPVLLSYKISNKFELLAGGELDYSFDTNINNLKNKEFGGSLIFGAQYNINPHWFIDARYIHGLTDQFFTSNMFNELGFGKRRSFSFGVGYKF